VGFGRQPRADPGGSGGAIEGDRELLDTYARPVDLEECGVRVAPAAPGDRFTHGADVHHADVTDRPDEGRVARPADHDVGRIVAEEGRNLLVVEVGGERLGRVGRGAVDDHELTAVGQGHPLHGGETGEPGQDEVPQLASHLEQALEPPPLALVLRGSDVRHVQRGQRAVAQALDAHGTGPHQPTPGLEGCGAGKAEVTGDEQALVAAALGRRQDGRERVFVTVDVGDAEEAHVPHEEYARLALRDHETFVRT
jgi:hypothetical protein